MSRYLQRLVDTAAGRTAAVHPRTGSIFSPRVQERHAPLHGWEDTEQVTLAQPSPRPHATPPEFEPPESHRRVTPGSEHMPLRPKSVAREHRAAQPPPFVSAESESAASPVDPVDDRTPEPQNRPVAAEADVDVTVPAPASVRAADAFQSVMKRTGVSDSVGSSAAPRDRSRQRQLAQAAQRPDEIQIHIGRIEVVAVPPPATRVPNAPDRSLSLEAYLSRRDRRAQ